MCPHMLVGSRIPCGCPPELTLGKSERLAGLTRQWALDLRQTT